MSERFTNYITRRSYNKGNTQIIIPKDGTSVGNNGVGSRGSNSTCQLHSIYITKEVSANYTSDPLSQASIISLSIVDTSANKEFFIANNVMVLPHSSFYIEKTITLLPQQQLKLTYANMSPNTDGVYLNTICSSVDIT